MSPGPNGRHSWVSEWDIRPKDDPERFACTTCGAGPDAAIHYTDQEEELLAWGAPLTASGRDFRIFKAAVELSAGPGGALAREEWEQVLRIIVELVEELRDREEAHRG